MAPNSNEVIKESQKSLELSDEEKNLITAYRTLDKEAKRNIQGYINVVLNQNLNI